MSKPRQKIRHMVIPDTQVKPGDSIEHLGWAGQYAVEMRPDVIVHIGDHFDMPSLSSYDEGKKSFEGRRYHLDIEAGIAGMEAFLEPIRAEQARLIRNKEKQWNPRMVFCLGNHEIRIIRAIEKDSKLDGLMGLHQLELVRMGWEVYPFLRVVEIDGVCYSHFFTSGTKGLPVASASALANKKMMSCVMGHVQDRDIAYRRRANGQALTTLFAGIFYQHEEAYLGEQGNSSWRGIWIFNDVVNGAFDEMPVSMSFLEEKFGKGRAA